MQSEIVPHSILQLLFLCLMFSLTLVLPIRKILDTGLNAVVYMGGDPRNASQVRVRVSGREWEGKEASSGYGNQRLLLWATGTQSCWGTQGHCIDTP